MSVTSYDFIMDDDIQIESGDLAIGISDNQNAYAILKARKGQFYETPLIGVGMDNYINSPKSVRLLKKRIREELDKDDYTADNLTIEGDTDNYNISLLPIKSK